MRSLPEVPLLLATLAAPLLPLPWGILALLAIAFLWFLHRPPRREAVVVGLALAVAVAALGVGWWAGRQARASPRQWSLEVRAAYARLWDDLRGESATAARALSKPPETLAERLDAFRRLDDLQRGHGPGRRALLLLDPDGTPIAWAGEGLLHEPSGDLVPRGGTYYQAGFSAVTLLAVTPLDESRRPWRIVAGASFSNQTLPFLAFSRPLHWSLVDRPEQASPGAITVRLANAPTLVVEPTPGAVPQGPPWVAPVAWGAIAFALLALAVMRGVGLALAAGPPSHRERRAWITALVLGGVLAAGLSAALPLPILIALVTGLAVAAGGLSGRGVRFGESTRGAAAWGGAAVLALCAAAWGFQQGWGPLDLASSILAGPGVMGLRLAFSAAAFGLLCLLGRRAAAAPVAPQGDRWAWLAILLLLGGAALADHPLVGLPLLVAGGATGSLHVSRRRLGEGMTLASLAVLAVLVAAGAWETAYRLRLRTYTGPELLSRLAAPSTEEVSALKKRLDSYFTGLDLRELSPRSPAGQERQDLAFAIWRGSPLARPYALSAVVVEPREGAASSFSFGMPLNNRQVDSNPGSLEELVLPVWEEALTAGQSELLLAGRPWGTVRYWLVPRPGFQLGERQRLEEVEAGLLKGGPAASPAADLASPALYALYDEDGAAALSPWEEAPPLEPRLRNSPGSPIRRAWTLIPSGPARAAVRAAPRGWEVVYLPVQTPLNALERAASSALGVLLLLAFATPFALLLALPRAAFRDLLWRVVRSYSKRLMAIYTVLLFLPLLLLSFVLMRSMEARLEREQRVAGETALASAQKLLGEYILTLPPGFDLGTALDDELLAWHSEVVHHEVNLYWGSNVYASSKHELFTAGLLPKRIPGEIYSRLVLNRYSLSSRINRAGGTAYLELYAPLRIPGEPRGEERLFLSMPLLAQQEEAARNLAQMRRRGLLVTAGLFILLVAVGARLARNFTRPLMQLVEGTRRIAGGATSLDLAPTELELAALVEAVDEMARRIAEGRERLVREKQVVERMVENITSGVVSLDRDRRVLMRNRVAAELLGAEVGESLQEVVERSGLAPVAAFLGAAGGEMARETVRLPNPAGADGDAEGGEREWTLVWVPLPGAGEPSALLVAEDATEILRSQRLLAWAEMARIIAHEIKNPLTPIRLSAEHMREVYRNDPGHFDRVFERCTSNILTQVDELRSIASEFSAYSAIPRIDPRPGDLTAAMAELVEGYRAAPPEGVSVDLETDGPIQTRFDAKLLGRAVRNLLENALRATSTSGGRVVVRVERLNGSARIAVVDSGPGVRPDLLPRIFDPYFSTHDTGTGLGLPIARRIAEEHGGGIAARNRPEGGLEVVVTLPVTN